LLFFLIFGLIGAAIVEGAAFFETKTGPTTVTHIIAAAIGLTLAYAAGMTVLMVEVIRFLIGAVKEAEKTVEGELGNLGGIVGEVGKAIEKRL
jgi:hypothetical protein